MKTKSIVFLCVVMCFLSFEGCGNAEEPSNPTSSEMTEDDNFVETETPELTVAVVNEAIVNDGKDIYPDKEDFIEEYFSSDGSVSVRINFDTRESVIIDGDTVISVEIGNGIYGTYIEKTDVDNDGEDEYIIAECENTGTGVAIYGLCIVEKVGPGYIQTLYDGGYFADIINDRVGYDYDPESHEITFLAQNSDGPVSFTERIEREDSDEYNLTDVFFRDIIRIRLIDGKPYLSAPSCYFFEDSYEPEMCCAVEVSAPIFVDEDSYITVGDITFGEDSGNKLP